MRGLRRTKGSRDCEERGFRKPPVAASLSRRALNFPRLNRRAVIAADGVARCFLSLLSSARERRKVAKAPVSSLLLPYVIYRTE